MAGRTVRADPSSLWLSAAILAALKHEARRAARVRLRFGGVFLVCGRWSSRMSLIPPSLTVSTAQRLATTILCPLSVKCWGVAARPSEPRVVQKG